MSNLSPPPDPTLRYHSDSQIPPDWTNPTSHTLSPLGRARILRRTLLFIILLQLLICAIIGYFTFGTAAWRLPHTRQALLTWALVTLAILALMDLRRIYQLRRSWNSFRLILADQGLLRIAHNLPPLEIRREEIKKIIIGKYGLVIRTHTHAQKFLFLHREIADYDAIRSRLTAWQPLQPVRRAAALIALSLTIQLALTAAILVPYFIAFRLPSLHTSLLCIALILALGLAYAFHIRRSPNLPTSRKIAVLLTPLLLSLILLAHLFLRHLPHYLHTGHWF